MLLHEQTKHKSAQAIGKKTPDNIRFLSLLDNMHCEFSSEKDLRHVSYRVVVQQSQKLDKATNGCDSSNDSKQQEAEVLDPAVLDRNNVRSELPKPALGFRGSRSHGRTRGRYLSFSRERLDGRGNRGCFRRHSVMRSPGHSVRTCLYEVLMEFAAEVSGILSPRIKRAFARGNVIKRSNKRF